ncbi:MAG: 16S rRNA methyltransferase [Acidobacteria bacterium]|nr:MAG: 16S rRNA methyltransferase [Acidobacteriota bacterium]
MTRRRWIADEVSGRRAALVGSHAHHLSRVLRARLGQEFDIVTGDAVRRARIASIQDDRIEFELGEEVPAATPLHITLALAIFKFDRMEWAIEKCTELGIARVIPIIAQRTGQHLAAAAGKRVERWRRIVKQAAEQSRRSDIPEISLPLKLKEAVALTAETRILLAECENEVLLKDAIREHPPDGEVVLAIGPEGGWTEEEVQLFAGNGWTSASLGATILRAETAAIAATAIIVSESQ